MARKFFMLCCTVYVHDTHPVHFSETLYCISHEFSFLILSLFLARYDTHGVLLELRFYMPFLSSTWTVFGPKFGNCGRIIGQKSTYLVPTWRLIAFCVRHCNTTCPQFCLHLIMIATSTLCLMLYSVCLTTQTVLRYLYKCSVVKNCEILEVKVEANMLFLFYLFPQGPILPGAHSIERFLIEEHLHQIVEMHHLERKDW